MDSAMKDECKTKKQLINELIQLRQCFSELQVKEVKLNLLEDVLRESNREKEIILDNIMELVAYQDKEMRILWTNRAACESVGLNSQQFVGYHCYEISYHRDKPCEGCPVVKALKTGMLQEGEITTPDRKAWFIRVYPVRDKEGSVIGAIKISMDITGRKKTEEELYALSFRDELTGLYNRRGFVTLAEQQLKIAGRMNKEMLLLFADFDELKRINDIYGHREGDRALLEVSDILKWIFRESDIIARIGGDEFVVLAVETEDVNADILSVRLRETLNAFNAKADLPYALALSAGIAHYNPEDPCSIDELLVCADKLMYEEKRKRYV
jgi:diguanylate cyclase (GGDEF)-like protein/PAS domain S-box-containing protein